MTFSRTRYSFSDSRTLKSEARWLGYKKVQVRLECQLFLAVCSLYFVVYNIYIYYLLREEASKEIEKL